VDFFVLGHLNMAKDTTAKIAALKEKKDQLAKRLAALEQKARTDDRKRETRQKIIVGGLVLAYMEKDPSFADRIRELIAGGVTRPHDREAVAELLAMPAPLSSLPSPNAPASEPTGHIDAVEFGRVS
jgi:hypothetical protein